MKPWLLGATCINLMLPYSVTLAQCVYQFNPPAAIPKGSALDPVYNFGDSGIPYGQDTYDKLAWAQEQWDELTACVNFSPPWYTDETTLPPCGAPPDPSTSIILLSGEEWSNWVVGCEQSPTSAGVTKVRVYEDPYSHRVEWRPDTGINARNYVWQINEPQRNSPAAHLPTVMLHEFGHWLGLGHFTSIVEANIMHQPQTVGYGHLTQLAEMDKRCLRELETTRTEECCIDRGGPCRGCNASWGEIKVCFGNPGFAGGSEWPTPLNESLYVPETPLAAGYGRQRIFWSDFDAGAYKYLVYRSTDGGIMYDLISEVEHSDWDPSWGYWDVFDQEAPIDEQLLYRVVSATESNEFRQATSLGRSPLKESSRATLSEVGDCIITYGDYCYVGEGNGILEIFDISDLNNIQSIRQMDLEAIGLWGTPNNDPQGFAIVEIEMTGGPQELLLLVVPGVGIGLFRIDHLPGNPQFKGTFEVPDVYSLTVSADKVYVSRYAGGMDIYRLDGLLPPYPQWVLLSHFTLNGPSAGRVYHYMGALGGQYLLVEAVFTPWCAGTQPCGLRIIDVSAPANPVEVSSLGRPSGWPYPWNPIWAAGTVSSNGKAVLFCDSNAPGPIIAIADVSNPSSPSILRWWENKLFVDYNYFYGKSRHVFKRGKYVYAFGTALTYVNNTTQLWGGAEAYDYDVLADSGYQDVEYVGGFAGPGLSAISDHSMYPTAVAEGNSRVFVALWDWITERRELHVLADDAFEETLIIGVKEEGAGTGLGGMPWLGRSRPNPFNPLTSIPYAVARRDRVLVRVYDVAGRLVRTLVDATQEPGEYMVEWDGRDQKGEHVPSGVYFHELQVGSFRQTGKMVAVK